jgi:alkylated DNA repair dioxygenase AlkB
MVRSLANLFPPEGFVYSEEFISHAEQNALVLEIEKLPLKQFEFRQYLGNRRTISFGWKYDFTSAKLKQVDEIPDFLLPLREKAAAFAGLKPEDFIHALAIEYAPGTQIGWHRDKPVFEDVVGVSLLSECPFRLRRKTVDGKWERFTQMLAPRSAYLLRDVVRNHWEHSIPPADQLRYSVTFRSLRDSK